MADASGILCFASWQQQQQQQKQLQQASGLSTWGINNNNNNNNNIGSNNSCNFFGEQQGRIGRVTPTQADTPTTNTTTTADINTAMATKATTATNSSSSGGLGNELGDALDDAFLAKEMNELSFEERQNLLEEVHGVATTIEDSTEFDLTKTLSDFDVALAKIPKSKRKAYDRACFLRPSLSSDIKYKLMFLRSTGFDSLKAATKLVNHFELKSTIFLFESNNDESLLAKDITYEDIGIESQNFSKVFGKSSIFLPRKDQVGRPVWFTNLNNVNWHEQFQAIIEDDNGYFMLRFMWYYFWSIVCDDEDAQKQGICRIAYSPVVYEDDDPRDDKDRNPFSPFSSSSAGNNTTSDRQNSGYYARNFSKIASIMMRGRQLIESLPIRFSSYHFCNANPGINTALNLIRLCFGKEMRIRMRAHTGSPLEMQYLLQSFGIDCHGLMVGGSTSCIQQHIRFMDEYIQERKRIENDKQLSIAQREQETQIVLCPSKHDVLIGRGSPHQDYIGNKLFLKLVVEPQLPKYMQQSDQFWKTCISMDAVQIIQQQYGGRYLQRSSPATSGKGKKKKKKKKTSTHVGDDNTTASSGWLILDDVKARDKASAMFRYKARTYKKAVANANAAEPLPLTVTNNDLDGLTLNEGSLSIESTVVVAMNRKHPHDSIITTNDNSNGVATAAGTAAKRLRV